MASRISLNCCRSSHLPECWYNFLMFLRNLCSKRELLINDWQIPIVFMWSLRHGYCNTLLSLTHFLFKTIDGKNIINHLSHYNGFNTLLCLVIFTINLKKKYLPTGVNFTVVRKVKEHTSMSLIPCAWFLGLKWLECYDFSLDIS